MSDFNILIIDDEQSQIVSLSSFLKRRNYQVYSANSGKAGISKIHDENIDMVITDYRMPEMTGLEVVKEVNKINPDLPVVVITAFSDLKDAIQVMKEGAFDYLSKPIDLDELEVIIKKAQARCELISENKLLKEQLRDEFKSDFIITNSSKMEKILSITNRVAQSDSTVLIRGETGTGKELIAKALHYGSARKDKQMISVNCAALSENLLESELFGHEKGSFTGAHSQRIGRFEQADGGTLFIDEIGDISLQTQVKLLRALQFGEFERIGGSKTIKVDVRVVTATNRDLEEMIKNGDFREDLFYRINVISINLPPLRERKEDIKLLVDHFLKKYSQKNNKSVNDVSKEAYKKLMQYNFPGNIRELENLIESAIVMSSGDLLTEDDFNLFQDKKHDSILNPNDLSESYPEKVEAFETALITNALKIKSGNQTQAAKLLGITERHLRSRMEKYGIINKNK